MNMNYLGEEMQEILIESSDLTEFSRIVIPELMRLTSASAGSVLVEKDGVLIVHTAYGLKSNRANAARIPLGVGVTGRAAKTQSRQWIPDVREVENFIEGVENSRWELAIPLSQDEFTTSLVIDLESNTEQRPDDIERAKIIDSLESVKIALLRLAENYCLQKNYRTDFTSSLMNRKFFTDTLEDWLDNNPTSNGTLFTAELKPLTETREVNSFNTLQSHIRTLGEELQDSLKQEAFITRLYGIIFAGFLPGITTTKNSEVHSLLQIDNEKKYTIEKLNFTNLKEVEEDTNILINEAFVELHFDSEETSSTKNTSLNNILRNGAINLAKQPILSSDTEEIVGYEILVRGPENSQLEPPNKLFESAYQEDRVTELDTLIAKKALLDTNGLKSYRLFLNVERKSLIDSNWRNTFIELLREDDSIEICIEITEHGNMINLQEPINQIKKELHSRVQFAIDDFGTGSSNFNAIIELNPDILKFDRSLIRQINKDFEKRSLMESIINFSRTNNMVVLAEGIEEAEEWETVKSIGVDMAQGYYFAKPALLN